MKIPEGGKRPVSTALPGAWARTREADDRNDEADLFRRGARSRDFRCSVWGRHCWWERRVGEALASHRWSIGPAVGMGRVRPSTARHGPARHRETCPSRIIVRG